MGSHHIFNVFFNGDSGLEQFVVTQYWKMVFVSCVLQALLVPVMLGAEQ